MRPTALVLAGLAALLVPFSVVYWTWSDEPSGNVLFALVLVALVFLASYLWRTGRGPAPPEDRADAAVADGAGEGGVFPARSVWPLAAAGSATLLAFGLAFTGWLALPGALGLVTACVALAVESAPTDDEDAAPAPYSETE
jgi:hypothetical protein